MSTGCDKLNGHTMATGITDTSLPSVGPPATCDVVHSLPTAKGRHGEGNRIILPEDVIHDLVPSIQEVGILEPGLVFDVPGTDLYEVLIGNRRFRACAILGIPFLARKLDHVPKLSERIK